MQIDHVGGIFALVTLLVCEFLPKGVGVLGLGPLPDNYDIYNSYVLSTEGCCAGFL